ncbi:competence type IV pilus assembly protein ComGB [Vagococcus zengguangii]|uniref:Type II secretion system F family protein n=1 Tax=Vagococcus zengguangii TaxID=2571750 RepID=A0A4D7CNT8_9ENTE|nr:competence type IV pilus assembly protein ComGB [Vagococcus zengguangii]QCI85729.1 type II secretion system F family protein [Vagococcus zengguangii]TLG81670.1 type II secretion system F family protein [Vagococcus zengguangii]
MNDKTKYRASNSVWKTTLRGKSSKLSIQLQLNVMRMLADMLNNGFSFQESLAFLGLIYENKAILFQQVGQRVIETGAIAPGFKLLGLKSQYLAQINLSERHGDLAGTFSRIAGQLADYQKQKKSLIKVLFYPSVLLLFLAMMLLLMKFYLLPSMAFVSSNKNFGIWLVEMSPYVMLSLFGGVLGLWIALAYHKKTQTARAHYRLLAKLPLVGRLTKVYTTSYLAHEWGKLLAQGIELTEIVIIMKEQENTKLMQELGLVFQEASQRGVAIYEVLAEFSFFLPGFAIIVRQGEQKGKLAEELHLYSQKLWEELLNKIEQLTNYLQPLIFLLVAVMIIAIYAAMLLPVYQNIEVFT